MYINLTPIKSNRYNTWCTHETVTKQTSNLLWKPAVGLTAWPPRNHGCHREIAHVRKDQLPKDHLSVGWHVRSIVKNSEFVLLINGNRHQIWSRILCWKKPEIPEIQFWRLLWFVQEFSMVHAIFFGVGFRCNQTKDPRVQHQGLFFWR